MGLSSHACKILHLLLLGGSHKPFGGASSVLFARVCLPSLYRLQLSCFFFVFMFKVDLSNVISHDFSCLMHFIIYIMYPLHLFEFSCFMGRLPAQASSPTRLEKEIPLAHKKQFDVSARVLSVATKQTPPKLRKKSIMSPPTRVYSGHLPDSERIHLFPHSLSPSRLKKRHRFDWPKTESPRFSVLFRRGN